MTDLQLGGLHHVTAITADAPGNRRFYTDTLGLRLVKKTVNQDDTSAYHLFYADGLASPGTDMTFFDWPLPRERRGTHSIARTGLRVAGEASLAWWRDRLAERGLTPGELAETDGRATLDFEDPEGQRFRLTDDGGAGAAHPWEASPVPAEHQIRGLGPVTISVPRLEPTEAVLTRVMHMAKVRTYASPDGEGTVHVYAMGPGGPAAELHVAVQPGLPVARQGAGAVHHVAFRTPDVETMHAWTRHLAAVGRAVERRGRALLLPLALLPRARRQPVRDRHRRPRLRRRRAAGDARAAAVAAAVPRGPAGRDRARSRADRLTPALARRRGSGRVA